MFSSLLGILDTKTSSDKRSMLSGLLGSLKSSNKNSNDKRSNKNSNDKRSNEKRGKCTFSCDDSSKTHNFSICNVVLFFFLGLPVARDVNCFFFVFLVNLKPVFSDFSQYFWSVYITRQKYVPPNQTKYYYQITII